MKRISISFISTVFALFALAICAYSLFYSSEPATKPQGIYWFSIALVAAVLPYLKDLTPYIRRVKVGDVEVELNELNDSFSLELAQAIEKFQAENGVISDGIAGTITLSRIRELLPS